jgi:hypothetical protein
MQERAIADAVRALGGVISPCTQMRYDKISSVLMQSVSASLAEQRHTRRDATCARALMLRNANRGCSCRGAIVDTQRGVVRVSKRSLVVVGVCYRA